MPSVECKIFSGGKQSGTKGYFVEPTVFSNVEDHFKIATEEIFGKPSYLFPFRNLW